MKITWYDAISRELENDFIKNINRDSSGIELLAINKTIGTPILLKDVVIIITEVSSDGKSEVTIIPRNWIISPKKFKK